MTNQLLFCGLFAIIDMTLQIDFGHQVASLTRSDLGSQLSRIIVVDKRYARLLNDLEETPDLH